MRVISIVAFFVVACIAAGYALGGEPAGEVLAFRGASDASAAVAVTDDRIIVADDENNTLRIYSTAKPGPPVGSYDVTKFLGADRQSLEADIEGATMVGRRIYWITSHGRNKEGKIKTSRYRFFATDVNVENGRGTIAPAGRPCKTLVHDLVKTEAGRRLGLDKATRFDAAKLKKKEQQKLAPKEDGLNIEGLCASPDGQTLYIGFRNPRPVNKKTGREEAIVVPLQNPAGLVERGEAPVFGEPLQWDLAGLGIRSMEYSPFHKAYFIIAGGPDDDDEGGFVLYRWSGKPDEKPALVRKLDFAQSQFSPEALVPFAGSNRLLLLSDDGSIPVKVAGPHECAEGEYRQDGTSLNKFLLDPNKKTFRATWLVP